jgi:hypothetical protein
VYGAEFALGGFFWNSVSEMDFAAQKGVVVYNYGLINEGVGVFGSLEDARRGFREYTGFEWTTERRWKEYGSEEYSEEYGECDVFEDEVNE